MLLSAIVIVYNEETVIARCLKSLSFANEVIVVDSGSVDRTRDIARSLGAKVIKQDWLGYGRQKNFGLSHARGEWALFVDADEEVPPDLAAEIQRVTKTCCVPPKLHAQEDNLLRPSEALREGGQPATSPAASYYWLRILTVFMHKPLRHLTGHNLRLFRKNAGRWTDAKVHEQVTRFSASLQAPKGGAAIHLNDPDTQILAAPLLHHSHDTVRSYLKTMRVYAALDAEEMAQTGRHRSGRLVSPAWWLPVYLSGRQFIKLLFYRSGVLDGPAGWVWCALSAYYEWVMGNKYLEIKKQV